MTTQQIAQDFVALCQQGKFAEAGEKHWADDVVSLEAMGDMTESRGRAAVRAKGDWWSGTFEVTDLKVEGPYVHGDDFIVRFVMSTTNRQTGDKASMDETALYRLKDGKIAEERFFYAG